MSLGLLALLAALASPPVKPAPAPVRLDPSCLANCDGELASCQANMTLRRDVNGGETAYCEHARALCVSRCRVYAPPPKAR